MPEAKPLMPITHWRNGSLAMLIVRMLKTQPLRQRHEMAFVEQAHERLAGFEAPDALDRGPLR